MTQIEQAFHEKWIKGVTLKMVWGGFIIILSVIGAVGTAVWYVANCLNKIERKIDDNHKDDKQFTKDQVSALRSDMNGKLDTIKINQVVNSYNTKLEIQKVRTQRPGLVTEKKVNGHIVFTEVSK